MKKFTKILSVALVAVMAFCAFAIVPASADDVITIKLGMSGPLTGGAALYGLAVQKGAQLAVDEINAKNDTFKFEFKAVDDQHDASKVQSAYATLTEWGMQVSLGCVTSAPCAEFVRLSSNAGSKVFFLTPSASNDDIASASNAYQLCFADGNQGAAAAAYVNQNYAGKKIGVLYKSGDNYSEGIFNQFKAALNNVQYVEASFTGDATDFSSQVQKLKDVEFVFLPIYYDPAYLFMQEAANQDVNFKVYYGCDGLDGIDAIEGADFSDITPEISYLSHFNPKAGGKTEAFVNAYKAKYNNETPIQFAAGAYDCVYAIWNAMKVIGTGEGKITAGITADALCTLLCEKFDNGFSYSGATGENMTWTRKTSGSGFVNKTASKFVVKEASAPKDDKKGGCGSSVSVCALALATLMGFGVAFVGKKKH